IQYNDSSNQFGIPHTVIVTITAAKAGAESPWGLLLLLIESLQATPSELIVIPIILIIAAAIIIPIIIYNKRMK
ncbi:MAG: hypothetical protein ACFFDN_39245, partial [Candidatus Hodarchaeota archaeon]